MSEQEKYPDQWVYETKCRRCGELTDWSFSDRKKFTWLEFANAMTDMIQFPRPYHCEKCHKETVQDVVSYDKANP